MSALTNIMIGLVATLIAYSAKKSTQSNIIAVISWMAVILAFNLIRAGW